MFMYFELPNEDLKKILANLDESEKDVLPTVSAIMQKMVGVIDEEPGRAEFVDILKSIASSISLIIDMNENG